MICAGIDYSTTSPSICIFKDDGTINPSNCVYHCFAIDKWRDGWSSIQNVNCYKLPKELRDLSKFKFLAEWTIEAIRWFDNRVQKVILETIILIRFGFLMSLRLRPSQLSCIPLQALACHQ